MSYRTLRGNEDPLPETLTKPVNEMSKKEGEKKKTPQRPGSSIILFLFYLHPAELVSDPLSGKSAGGTH